MINRCSVVQRLIYLYSVEFIDLTHFSVCHLIFRPVVINCWFQIHQKAMHSAFPHLQLGPPPPPSTSATTRCRASAARSSLAEEPPACPPPVYLPSLAPLIAAACSNKHC